MIQINEEWYDPKDLDDICSITRELFNYDLADKLCELVEELKTDSEYELDSKQDEIDSLESDISDKDSRIYDLEQEVKRLEEEIKELEILVDYWSGMARINTESDDD